MVNIIYKGKDLVIWIILVVNDNDLIGNGVILIDFIFYEGCDVIYICLD